jgi:hypothetical protein
MTKSRQEVFDICIAIIFAAILLAISAWIAVDNTEKPCKYVSPYSNTLQHDIHRQIKCEDK